MVRLLHARLAWLTVLCALPLFLGCSRVPKTEVEGTVTWDGKPLHHGTISFIPTGPGHSAGGEVDEGKYHVLDVSPGKNVVTVESSSPQMVNLGEAMQQGMSQMKGNDKGGDKKGAAKGEKKGEAKGEKKGEAKAEKEGAPKTGPAGTIPGKATGNNEVYDIGNGKVKLDIVIHSPKE